MDGLWHRTLAELRDRFRQLHKLESPAYHVLTERIQGPSDDSKPLPSVLPDWNYLRISVGVSEESHPVELSNWVGPPWNDGDCFSDLSGKVWAALSHRVVNHGEFRCNEAGRLEQFAAIEKDASNAITGTPVEILPVLPESVRVLCSRKPRIQRYKFGTVRHEPTSFLAHGRNKGILQDEHGVLIDWIFDDPHWLDDSHWMLILHRLAWRRHSLPRLDARRWCVDEKGNSKVAYDLVRDRRPTQWDVIKRVRESVDQTQWYSVLGDNVPLDVFDASARAIDIILEHAKAAAKAATIDASINTPQSTGPKMPAPSVRDDRNPAVVLQGRNLPALVNGKEKRLNTSQYDVVESLIKAKPLGLTKDTLEKVRTDARGILSRLRHDDDWERVIHMAEMSGGRYRID